MSSVQKKRSDNSRKSNSDESEDDYDSECRQEKMCYWDLTMIFLMKWKNDSHKNPSSYMCLRTNIPNPIPTNVAMEIPNIPARILGATKEAHPFAVAIPQAVVGPPTLALDAKSNIFRFIPNSFPKPRITIRWTVTWTKANIKILGAVLMTCQILPLAPTTAKKTCFKEEWIITPTKE